MIEFYNVLFSINDSIRAFSGYLLGLTGSYNHGFVLAGTIFETMCMKGTMQMQANNRLDMQKAYMSIYKSAST